MSCTHQTSRQVWVEEENWYTGETEGHWEWKTEQTIVDIDIGRYKCTRCGEVMYYTGTWRKHWTGE